MEKLTDNSHSFLWRYLRRILHNPYFARTTADHAAFCIVVCGAQIAIWYEICHVLGYYRQPPPHSDVIIMTTSSAFMHICIGIVLYINSLGNLYKIIRTKVVCDLTTLCDAGVDQSSEWSYCARCCLNQPPRTHHCVVCDVCITRQDHHCWFAGTCIGHANHRYYICMVMSMFTAALYSFIFNYEFVWNTLSHLSWALPICLIAPHFGALLGWLSLHEFLICVLTFISIILLIMLTWLLQIQVVQLIYGQTRFERKRGNTAYHQGLVGNIRAILGRRWYIAWLSPWIHSSIPGDGVTFRIIESKAK